MEKKILSILMLLILIQALTIIVTSDTNSYNAAPNPPEIEGPSSGRAGRYYDYSFTLTDPDEDDILSILEIDFGDELVVKTKKNCERPWYNGSILTEQYSWNNQGQHSIKARVMDGNGEWSEWSDPYPVSMPKTKVSFIFSTFFKKLLSNFFYFSLS